ncbi:hypothetical protein ACQKPX_10275 [Photobacterium sp. DNB23_23_1]
MAHLKHKEVRDKIKNTFQSINFEILFSLINTITIVTGVFLAVQQLKYISEQNSIQKNSYFHGILDKYNEVVHKEANMIFIDYKYDAEIISVPDNPNQNINVERSFSMNFSDEKVGFDNHKLKFEEIHSINWVMKMRNHKIGENLDIDQIADSFFNIESVIRRVYSCEIIDLCPTNEASTLICSTLQDIYSVTSTYLLLSGNDINIDYSTIPINPKMTYVEYMSRAENSFKKYINHFSCKIEARDQHFKKMKEHEEKIRKEKAIYFQIDSINPISLTPDFKTS